MHVLLADALDPAAVARLAGLGHDVEERPDLGVDDLPAAVAGADVLVVRSTKVTAATFAAADRLSLVVRAGAGTENIDTGAASARGIHVCNVPGRNAVAVAELTMGLLLAVDRHIADATADLRAGRWDKKRYSEAAGLMGATMGIIGLGEIGLRVAERARAFGMRVISVRKEGRSERCEAAIRQIGIRLVDDLPELVAACDVVSIHVPGGEATRDLVDAELLSHFRDGAVLLNTSRGDVVDEAALLEALDNRGLRAGLDVFRGEPASGTGEFGSALASHPRVVGTHHVGASTAQAQTAIADGVVEVIAAFAGGTPLHCINLAPRGVGRCTVTVRHLDKVGVLAGVFSILRAHGLNVENMENRVFEGLTAAVAAIEVGGVPDDAALAELEALPDVLGVAVVHREHR